MARGLILLLLLWWSWTAYVWLGNRVRTDQGLVRSGMLVVMAALFIAALVMPDAWSRHTGTVDAPLILAAAFIVVRLVYFGLHLTAAAEDTLEHASRHAEPGSPATPTPWSTSC